MRKQFLMLVLSASFALALAGCSENPLSLDNETDKSAQSLTPRGHQHGRGKIVVANRASGSIAVIDARSTALIGNFDLPQGDGDATPEPMYLNPVNSHHRLFVGDRANNRVVVFNSRNFQVEGTIAAGQGVFHMWADRQGRQLWVNNDIDNTITVIDVRTLEVLGTVDIPDDLVAMGGKPHDVILDHQGRYAYVTVLGVAGANDYLLQFDTGSFTEMSRQPVGKDPHVSLGRNTDLYVPCQNSDQVLVFDPQSLALLEEITVPGAHGATMASNGKFFYTTNLPGGGMGALYTISTRRNQVVGEAVDTPYPVPHNLALTSNSKRLFVTHSGGSADKVTVYDLVGKYRQPQFIGEITVGLNPFGITYLD